MKRKKWALLLAFCATCGSDAMAADRSTGGSDDAAIHALVRTEMEGASQHDIDKVMSVYAPGSELVLYDAAPGTFVGWQAMKDAYLKYFKEFPGKPQIAIEDLHIGYSGDLAYAFSKQTWNFVRPDGAVVDTVQRVTNIYKKLNGKWLCIHEHASVPADYFKNK